MLALVRPDPLPEVGEADTTTAPLVLALPIERGVYGAPRGAKPKAVAVTLAIHAALIAAFAIQFSEPSTVAKPSAPLVVALLPLASPPEETDRTEKENPQPAREKETRPIPPKIEPIQQSPRHWRGR
ncbi:hypothetical protein [Flavisphingomonas formosensis]|uniref:hypothetical protein n=1 Tax=Flavisphingomonas formosensis TaxID=861534 RepID=UPI0012F71829|nr:hypothetical protein [Sphingomonas formosensis]